MAVVNQYKFVGIDNNTPMDALNPLGAGYSFRLVKLMLLNLYLVTSAGTPSVTVTNNAITAIKTVGLTANITKELLTQPLIVVGGTTLTITSKHNRLI